MSQLIRAVTRYVPSKFGPLPFEIRLVYWPNAVPDPCYTINTPCACLHAKGTESEADLHRTHHRTTFATEAEAASVVDCFPNGPRRHRNPV